MDIFNSLVLSGGGPKGIGTLGALHYLYANNMMDMISNFTSSSIGAIISYLLILGYLPLEIMVQLCVRQILDKMTDFNITNILNDKGALSFSPIQEELEKMTIEKAGRFHTLKSLKDKYSKNLTCVTYNFTKDMVEFLSSETHPDLPCITALRMTSNLPFIFEKFKYMGDYYLDGGIVNNFPINFENKKGNNVLGILLNDAESSPFKNTDGIEYIYNVLRTPFKHCTEHLLKNVLDHSEAKFTILKLSMISISYINMKMDITTTLDMFSQGYNKAKEFFENNDIYVPNTT